MTDGWKRVARVEDAELPDYEEGQRLAGNLEQNNRVVELYDDGEGGPVFVEEASEHGARCVRVATVNPRRGGKFEIAGCLAEAVIAAEYRVVYSYTSQTAYIEREVSDDE